MLKFFNLLIFVFFCSTFLTSNSYYEKVEEVFLDINKDYKHYKELQSLYDKGFIYPDKDGKFNPNKLLTRSDFVGMVMEVSCKRCVKPYAALDYIMKYTGKDVFFDVKETDRNFYCIAEAKEKDVVKGYDVSHVCQDGTTKKGLSPFCANDNITLEEALAVLLRNSSVFTIEDNNAVIGQIISGNITKDLSNDVRARNSDGTPYAFYGYFKKALEISYSEYDLYGNLKTYSLVSIDSKGNLNPKKFISKEEFLIMSYIVSKLNSCLDSSKNGFKNGGIFGKIDVYDKKCSAGDKNCKKSDLNDYEGIYDFDANVDSVHKEGVRDYIWVFHNKDTGEVRVKKGKYIDNHKFPSYGTWQIRLIVIDDYGNRAEFYNEISYFDSSKIKPGDNNLSVSIDVSPITGQGPLKVDFKAIVSNCDDCKYDWNFGDSYKSNSKNPSNVFLYDGIYDVELTVTDKNGNKARGTLIMRVGENYDDFVNDLNKFKMKYSLEEGLVKDIEDLIGLVKNGASKGDISKKINEIKDYIDRSGNASLYDLKDYLGKISSDYKIDDSKIDSDRDGVFDSDDKCLLVFGDKKNNGCPILDQVCDPNAKESTCKSGFVCNSNGLCEVKKDDQNLVSSCLYPSSKSSIFGNVICDNCPCDFSLSFLSRLRKCDIIFPAITSPDKKEIYGQGQFYQIPYSY